MNEGESVVMECKIHADKYNLFDFPVLWRKFQRGEETQMNIMGNMNEPFAASNRFENAFIFLAHRYQFELSVLGENYGDLFGKPEDGGSALSFWLILTIEFFGFNI